MYLERSPSWHLRDRTLVNNLDLFLAFLEAYSSSIAVHKACGSLRVKSLMKMSLFEESSFLAINPAAYFCRSIQLFRSDASSVG